MVLDAIERKGSFAKAADELCRVPSAVTYSVQKLEQELGIVLFDRSGHRAVLTAPGRALLQDGRQLLAAASELESRLQRIATGWEGELTIAVDHLVPVAPLYDVIERFYRLGSGTRLRIMREVYSGTWDALVSGRADLAFGACDDGPVGGGYRSEQLGRLELLFTVAPRHPLAVLQRPLRHADILPHRAVVVRDTARDRAPRSAGLLTGQDTLVVPDLNAKLEVNRRGLGVAYLPRPLAEREQRAGRLIIKTVEGTSLATALSLAWRNADHGRALEWLIAELQNPAIKRRLLA